MDINPESKPISEIFSIEGKDIYNIPIYQRNYSWNNNNIEEFYNDLLNEDSGYYIGNLLVTPSQRNNYDIVDGQQRITTIALFFLAIYEELSHLIDLTSNKVIIGDISALQNDIRRKLRTSEKIPKLNLLDFDAKVYNSYLNVLDGKEKGKYGNRVFGKRYSYIQTLIKFSDEIDVPEHFLNLTELYTKLNNLEVLRITVNDLTDAFSIFTSINAKGLPLTLIDLLKSYYLKEATDAHSKDEEALAKWTSLITIFKNENDEPNSTLVTQFLQNNYDAFEGTGNSSITKRASLRKYEELFQTKGHEYIDELIANAQIFAAMVPRLKTPDAVEFSKSLEELILNLSKLEASPLYPLMMYLLKKTKSGEVSENTTEHVFTYLINFYLRRNIVLKPKSSNIRSRVIKTVRDLQKETDLNAASIAFTKNNLDKISATDEEFASALKGSVYDTATSTVRFALISLERKHGKYFNKQNPDRLDEYKENGQPEWSLEHILPQNIDHAPSWRAILSPDAPEEIEHIHAEHIHKLGNLTLTGYNTEMSNKPFVKKRDYTPKNSNQYTGLRTELFINESLVDTNETIEQKETWTIEDINRRTNILAELLLNDFSL